MRHAIDGAAMLEQQLKHSLREWGHERDQRTVDGALAAVRAFREGLMH